MRQKNEVRELMHNQKLEGFEPLTKVLTFPQNETKPVTVIWLLFVTDMLRKSYWTRRGACSFGDGATLRAALGGWKVVEALWWWA